jgi:hypothetical protein
LLKDSVPCPIPTIEKDAHRAAFPDATLPIGLWRSTLFVPAEALAGCYRAGLLQKKHTFPPL